MKLVTDVLCSNFPVCGLVSTAPCGCCHSTPSYLISQIHANNSWIVFIPFCHFSQTLKKLLFWILFIIPQSITIIRATTPLRFTGMIVQNHHQTWLCYNIDCMIKNLHCCLSMHFWIRFYQLEIYDIVFVKHLQRESKSDAVHVKCVTNLFTHVLQLSIFKTTYTMSLGMTSWPVSTCKFYSFSSSINNFHSLCWKGKFNFFYIK